MFRGGNKGISLLFGFYLGCTFAVTDGKNAAQLKRLYDLITGIPFNIVAYQSSEQTAAVT